MAAWFQISSKSVNLDQSINIKVLSTMVMKVLFSNGQKKCARHVRDEISVRTVAT
jgi:hypothetical protein